MSLNDYFIQNEPITNLPDLFHFTHSNPLGVPVLAQLLFIFIVVAVMTVVNYRIRYKGKSNLYPVLYTLFGISIVSILYYGFQSKSNFGFAQHSGYWTECIGWFCRPENFDSLGWAWGIIGIIALAFVIYSLFSAQMQTVAELSSSAGMIEGKPWKEWKISLVIFLVAIVFISVSVEANLQRITPWCLLVSLIVLLLFTIIKAVMDCRRYHKYGRSILIAVVYYFSILALLMLTIELISASLFLLLLFIVIFSRAKARKKGGDQKSNSQKKA